MDLSFLEETETEELTKRTNLNLNFGNASKFTGETIQEVYKWSKEQPKGKTIPRGYVITLLNPRYLDKISKDGKNINSLTDCKKLCDSLIIPLKEKAKEEGITNPTAVFFTRDNNTDKERVVINWSSAKFE